MKLFVLLSRVPWPLEKGDKLRAYHQLRELHRRHYVVLCCLSDSPVHPKAHTRLGDVCSELHLVPLSRWRIALNLALAVFSQKPFQVWYFYQRPAHRAIRELIARTGPDHIYCQLVRTAEYVKNEHNYPKTIDYQDALSKGMERREVRALWPLKAVYAIERRRLIAYENIIFEYFEAHAIISEEDRRHIYHPERKNIAVVSNGIDTTWYHPSHSESLKSQQLACEVLFTGHMSYPPNVEAARFLVLEVLPLLRNQYPGVRCVIAGASPAPRVQALAREPEVQLTGWIDDIRVAYASAVCFCAPMQSGTGLQNKLLEAMAMELPCVTSPLAAKPIKAGTNVLTTADTPQQYAYAIARLLNQPQAAKEQGRLGRLFAERHFSWAASTAVLEGVMTAANARRKPPVG